MHKERYDTFKKQADGVGNLDFTFFMKLMQFATDCIPQDRLEVCSYIFRLYCADIPSEEETPGQLQKSVDALGGGLTKIYCQVVYEERNKVCTFAT